MKVQFVVQGKSGIAYHRIINPMEFMEWDNNNSAEMLWIGQDEHKIDADILFYSKFIGSDTDFIKSLKQKGTKVVVDVDDFWELPVDHPFYNTWQQRGNAKKIIENIKLADLVTCTTLRLQDKIRQYNKNTIVIPNSFPFDHENYKPMPIAHEKMGFIYAGGSYHVHDVELLRGKFTRMGGDPYIKNNAEFILAGYEPTYIQKFETKEQWEKQNPTKLQVSGVWEKMSNVFAQTNSYKILPSTELDTYIDFYDQADVSLIPLRDTEFNSYKSELKIVEAGCKGIPVICSNVNPYSQLQGKDGIMWIDKPDDWIKHIKYCIKNPEYVKDMGEKMSGWVRDEYDLIKWNKTRQELFKSLIK
jgi:glycosyltransferase involved in cell wall biosynthesis